MDIKERLIQEAIARDIKIGKVIDRRHLSIEFTYPIVELTPHVDTSNDCFEYYDSDDRLEFSNRIVYYKGMWAKVCDANENFHSYEDYIPIFDNKTE